MVVFSVLRLLFVVWINSFCKEIHDPYANLAIKKSPKKRF